MTEKIDEVEINLGFAKVHWKDGRIDFDIQVRNQAVQTTGVQGIANRCLLEAATDIINGETESEFYSLCGMEVNDFGGQLGASFPKSQRSVATRFCKVARRSGLSVKRSNIQNTILVLLVDPTPGE